MKHTRNCMCCMDRDTDDHRERTLLPDALNFISENFPSIDPTVPRDLAELTSAEFLRVRFACLDEKQIGDLSSGKVLTGRGARPPSLHSDEDTAEAVRQLLVTQFFGSLLAEFGQDVLYAGTLGVLMLACRSYLSGSVGSSMSRDNDDRPRWAAIIRVVLDSELSDTDCDRSAVWRALERLFSTVGQEQSCLTKTLSPHIVMTAFILGLTNVMQNHETEVELMQIVSRTGQVGTEYGLTTA